MLRILLSLPVVLIVGTMTMTVTMMLRRRWRDGDGRAVGQLLVAGAQRGPGP